MSIFHCSRRWVRAIAVLILTISLGSITPGLGAEDTSVKEMNVLGTAAIHARNLADGRQQAVDNALTTAVGRAVMDMLTEETVVRRFQLINDSILTQRDQYIQNYRVLTESTSGSTIRVLVQVDVVADRLSRDLSQIGLALSGATSPRVLFMIAEKNAADDNIAFWWGAKAQKERTISGTAMAASLEDAGFEVLPVQALSAPLNLPLELREADMLALGNQLGADILIHGTGTATAATNTMGGGIQAFKAAVDVEAIDVQTGQAMGRSRQKAVASAQSAAVGGQEALTMAGTSTGDDLARQMMAAWQQKQDGSAVIDVAVEGTSGQIASFVKLRTAISSLSGVKELKMKEVATDHALIAVNYQGTARSMADALLLKTFSGFGIDIYEVTPQAVRIRLIKN